MVECREVTDGEELLWWIREDICKKYGIKSPRFMVCGKVVSEEGDVVRWIDKWRMVYSSRKWVRYRCVGGDLFELKEYFVSPPDSVCMKKIRDILGDCGEGVFYERFGVVYTADEIVGELLFGLRCRQERSWLVARGPVPDPNPRLNRVVYRIEFWDDEYGRSIPEGYHVLEKVG